MRPILAIAMKDVRLLMRDRMAFFFTFIFPILFGIFFGLIFSSGDGKGRSRLSVQLVDEDQTQESMAFADELSASSDLAVTIAPSRESAATAVRRGGGPMGYIALPKGYGERAGSPFSGESATIEIAGDPSRSAETSMLQGIVTELAYKGLSRTMGDTSRMRKTVRDSMTKLEGAEVADPQTRASLNTFYDALDNMLAVVPVEESTADGETKNPLSSWQPVKVEKSTIEVVRKGPANAFDVSFAQAILWGVMGCASGFAIGLTEERKAGTLLRLRVSPISWTHLLAGKGVGCFIACVSVVAVMLALGILVFKINVGSWMLLAFAVLSLCAGFVGIMMLLSVLGRKTGSGQLGWAIMLILSFIGGGAIPLFIMPGWMQTVSSISPVKWGILAIEGALWRGYDLQQMMLPCAILLGLAVAGFVSGAWLFSRGEQSA